MLHMSIYNPFISLELQIFEYRDITSTMMMRTSKLRKFLFKFSVKTGVSRKEYFERGWRWWSERMNWSKIAKKRWHRSTIGLMKFHEIAYSFPTRTAPMIWISKIACSFSPRWFLDRNFDEIGEAKGETKLSLILDTGFSPRLLSPKNGSQWIRHARAEIKEVAKFRFDYFPVLEKQLLNDPTHSRRRIFH